MGTERFTTTHLVVEFEDMNCIFGNRTHLPPHVWRALLDFLKDFE